MTDYFGDQHRNNPERTFHFMKIIKEIRYFIFVGWCEITRAIGKRLNQIGRYLCTGEDVYDKVIVLRRDAKIGMWVKDHYTDHGEKNPNKICLDFYPFTTTTRFTMDESEEIVRDFYDNDYDYAYVVVSPPTLWGNAELAQSKRNAMKTNI